VKISQILDKIDENQLFVPAFQREYVWKRENAKDLVASLIKDYPTGTMLTWETNNPPELKGGWRYDEKQGSVKLILDGQQRITTLYMLIRGNYPPYYKQQEITNDTRNLHVNVETLELQYYKKTLMANDPLWVNLTDIFQKKIRARDVVKTLRKKEDVADERDDLIDDNFRAIEAIPDRDFLEQSIPVKANIKEAIDIFYIVNASGVNLTEAELALAQMCGYWPSARELFKSKLQELEKHGFVFKLDFFVYAMLGVLHHVGSDMTKLHSPDNIDNAKDAWKLLSEEVFDYIMNVMKTHAYIDHTHEISSVYALVPIIVFTYIKFRQGTKHLSQEEINRVVKWFFYSQIRQRYISQLPQKLDKDISTVVKSANPFDDMLNMIKAERALKISEEEFVGLDIRHPMWSLMRWYFKSRNAVCFTTGLGIRKNMGKKYSLEWDHIFPYAVLRENGYDLNNRLKYSLAQEITNRVVLTQIANRGKFTKLAETYLEDVERQHPKALKLQTIPRDRSLWKLENFENFLRERRRMLAEELNQFLEKITATEETSVETPIETLVDEGENSGIEFKASLRWNHEEGKVDKKLEQVVAKTIAAFSNSEGGTLLIGVSDERDIIGLEHDFSSLGGNSDEFEVHLRNLVVSQFGTAFGATNLTISFPKVENVEICRIDVKKASAPQYLQVADKNGGKTEKFYVRSGNSSVELPLKEVATYVQIRFK
jgi:hypothetical protein